MIRSETNTTPTDDTLDRETIPFDVQGDPKSVIVVAIVERIAEITDQDVTEIPPLYDSINPGALTELVTGESDSPVTVSFPYQGCRITVSNDGRIRIEEPTH